MPKIVFWHHCYLALRSRSKVGVKVMGQGQTSGAQRSILGAWLCRVQLRAVRGITSLGCLCVCNQGAYTDNSADSVGRRLSTSNIKFNMLWPINQASFSSRCSHIFVLMSHCFILVNDMKNIYRQQCIPAEIFFGTLPTNWKKTF